MQSYVRQVATHTTWFHDVALFCALFSTAVALGGALAHLFEFANKMSLTGDQYFIVQSIYQGWWRFAYVLAVQFISIVTVVILYRRAPVVFASASSALICLIAAQVVFWTYTQPMNVATSNWTVQPADWDVLRRQWEHSHATGAGLQLVAMASLIVAALARK